MISAWASVIDPIYQLHRRQDLIEIFTCPDDKCRAVGDKE